MSANVLIGLQLTIYGMGLVFLLLAVLWGLIALLGRLDRMARPEPEALPAPARPLAATAPPPLAPELLAAITVAVLAHRAIRRGQAAPAMRSHPPGTLPSRWLVVGRGQQIDSWQPPKR